MYFSKHVDIKNGPTLPPPNNVGMKKRCHDRIKRTGLHKLQNYSGEGGEGRERKKLKAHRVNCPKTFVPHSSYHTP